MSQTIIRSIDEKINYHEECVAKVRKFSEENGCIVSRTGNFDILFSKEEYDDIAMPLPIRLSRLSADLTVVKEKNGKQDTFYVEIKTEDVNDEFGNLKFNLVQIAYFIHQFNQKGIRTMYCYFQRDGTEKGFWADELISERLIDTIKLGAADANEYVLSAIETMKKRK